MLIEADEVKTREGQVFAVALKAALLRDVVHKFSELVGVEVRFLDHEARELMLLHLQVAVCMFQLLDIVDKHLPAGAVVAEWVYCQDQSTGVLKGLLQFF